jgi:predicted nicotinamide N-methyase
MIKFFAKLQFYLLSLALQNVKHNTLKKQVEIVRLNDKEISLWIPDQKDIQLTYREEKNKSMFPFWAKLWPAAFVLAEFILDHQVWVNNKKVMELAAGLGLPSLIASRFATSVLCSDIDKNAVVFIKSNIELNKITNMTSALVDWTQLSDEMEWEVLLMSDVNYHPDNFEVLLKLIYRFLSKGKTIILSTPQRLVGKEFISALLPYCKVNEERWHNQVAINVLVLKN